MPALNFSKQFADAVEFGEKTQTIRQRRKVPIKIGDKLYLYSGMRVEPKATPLGEVICRATADVVINERKIVFAGRVLESSEEKYLAGNDGFDTVKDFRAWFRDHYGLPFHGVLIVWNKEEQA